MSNADKKAASNGAPNGDIPFEEQTEDQQLQTQIDEKTIEVINTLLFAFVITAFLSQYIDAVYLFLHSYVHCDPLYLIGVHVSTLVSTGFVSTVVSTGFLFSLGTLNMAPLHPAIHLY